MRKFWYLDIYSVHKNTPRFCWSRPLSLPYRRGTRYDDNPFDVHGRIQGCPSLSRQMINSTDNRGPFISDHPKRPCHIPRVALLYRG